MTIRDVEKFFKKIEKRKEEEKEQARQDSLEIQAAIKSYCDCGLTVEEVVLVLTGVSFEEFMTRVVH